MFGLGKDDKEDGREEGRQDLPNLGGNATHGGAYPAGGGYRYDEDDDLRGAADEASRNAGSSGDHGLFSTILTVISERKSQLSSEDVDEDHAVKSHKKYFGDEDDDKEADSGSLGSAAAIQALKLFTSGQSGGNQSQSAFIGLAMSEASKLFDEKASQGKVSTDSSKESAVTQAGQVALKMYLKSQGGQSSGGSGGGGGGVSSLLSMASKFM